MGNLPQIGNGAAGKNLAVGALAVSLAVAASTILPFISFLALPQAGLFTRIRFGRHAITVCAAQIVLIAILTNGILVDLFFLSGWFLMGYAMGASFLRKLPVEFTILLPAAVSLLAYFFGLFFYTNQLNVGIIAFLEEYVGKNLELILKSYEGTGGATEAIQLFTENFDSIRHDLVRLLPAITIAMTLIVTWLNLLISKTLQVAVRIRFNTFHSLNQWKAPEHLVWLVIGCGLSLIVADDGLRLVAVSGLLILMVIYFFQGIAIVSFFFEKKRFPRLLKIFMYSIIAVQQILLFFIVGLGFFDMWMNFRKLERKETN